MCRGAVITEVGSIRLPPDVKLRRSQLLGANWMRGDLASGLDATGRRSVWRRYNHLELLLKIFPQRWRWGADNGR